MKIMTIIGARPQFIKAAAVSREMRNRPDINEVIVHTGQHFDKNMSDIFFEEMDIPVPQYRLEINSLSHGAMTGRMLEMVEGILLKEEPDYVLVYGDTNTTLAGALAARKMNVKLMHVEAGLRSYNMHMPEEINRIVTDRISDILCCPTDTAIRNLRDEGFDRYNVSIVKTGDVMLDAARFYSSLSSEKSDIIHKLDLENNNFLLCTIHRAENTDDVYRLSDILDALNTIAQDIRVILPLHPRTEKIIASQNLSARIDKIDVIPPVSYFDIIELLKKTLLVLTDSGGLQKEAYFFNKACITLRDETEWTELVEAGSNVLAGADKMRIIAAYQKMKHTYTRTDSDLYGDGKSSKRIVDLFYSSTT